MQYLPGTAARIICTVYKRLRFRYERTGPLSRGRGPQETMKFPRISLFTSFKSDYSNEVFKVCTTPFLKANQKSMILVAWGSISRLLVHSGGRYLLQLLRTYTHTSITPRIGATYESSGVVPGTAAAVQLLYQCYTYIIVVHTVPVRSTDATRNSRRCIILAPTS